MNDIKWFSEKPQSSEIHYSTFEIVPDKKDLDYEVTSQFIFDQFSGKEYLTVKHALAKGANLVGEHQGKEFLFQQVEEENDVGVFLSNHPFYCFDQYFLIEVPYISVYYSIQEWKMLSFYVDIYFYIEWGGIPFEEIYHLFIY